MAGRPRSDRDPALTPVQITTSIPYHIHRECLKFDWSWSELLQAGYKLKTCGDNLHERITALEAELKAYKLQLQVKNKRLMEWSLKN